MKFIILFYVIFGLGAITANAMGKCDDPEDQRVYKIVNASCTHGTFTPAGLNVGTMICPEILSGYTSALGEMDRHRFDWENVMIEISAAGTPACPDSRPDTQLSFEFQRIR